MGMLKEFREFAIKGNLVDIAVAFVMGVAFAKVITSFTEGIISPLIGLITGEDLSAQKYIIREASIDPAGNVTKAEVALKWGAFVTAVIDFIIVAFIMFLIIKWITRMKRNRGGSPAAAAEPSSTDKLLMEIRDALKK